jgi:hypothetical protein
MLAGRVLTACQVLLAWGAALLLLAVVGCDKSGVGRTLPVSGKVTVNGQPLSKGTLAFKPDDSKGNTLKIEPGGDIENGTYVLFTNGKPGAPPGWYKVVIVGTQEIDSTNPTAVKPMVAPVYSDPQKTTLLVEVTDSPKEGAYDFLISK